MAASPHRCLDTAISQMRYSSACGTTRLKRKVVGLHDSHASDNSTSLLLFR